MKIHVIGTLSLKICKLSKASSRLYILRDCKYYGYSLQELTLLKMSLFTYAIEVWACAHYSKYLSQIDRFCKAGSTLWLHQQYTPITDVIRIKERLLWDKITTDSTNPLHELLPPQRSRSLRKRGHPYILPRVRTEHHKRCSVNRCLINFMYCNCYSYFCLTIDSCLSVRSSRYEACGKFGEHERCVRVARGAAESNCIFLSALQTSQVLHISMNTQLMHIV